MFTWLKQLLIKKSDPLQDDDFNKQCQKLEECAYFIRGYKCSLDCEHCQFALDDDTGMMDSFKASKLCKYYKKYYRCVAEMNEEEYRWYESLTKRQKSTYQKLSSMT